MDSQDSTSKNIYHCPTCRTTAELLCGQSRLYCCGRPMEPVPAEADPQEHLMTVEQGPEILHVHVGQPGHPMEEEHYIRWIEVIDGDQAYRQYLKPGQPPDARFRVLRAGEIRGYCIRHGLWRK